MPADHNNDRVVQLAKAGGTSSPLAFGRSPLVVVPFDVLEAALGSAFGFYLHMHDELDRESNDPDLSGSPQTLFRVPPECEPRKARWLMRVLRKLADLWLIRRVHADGRSMQYVAGWRCKRGRYVRLPPHIAERVYAAVARKRRGGRVEKHRPDLRLVVGGAT